MKGRILATKKSTIHDRGWGPEIEGTRITVHDVMHYYLDGWPAGRIANWLAQTTPDIQAAIDYIEAHRPEVEAEYRKIVERAERGNPPKVQALGSRSCKRRCRSTSLKRESGSPEFALDSPFLNSEADSEFADR